MAGHKNFALRQKVKKFLRSKKNRELSDREIAKLCECSRPVVKAVRIELIAIGKHEPIEAQGRSGPDRKYAPGAVSRGGYVYDEFGNSILQSTWDKRQAQERRAGITG